MSDIEAYFCQSEFLREFLGEDEQEADARIDHILDVRAKEIRDQFDKQRGSHNQEFHSAGGSPTNDDVWANFQGRPLRGAKGKYVFNQLKNTVPENKFREEAILKHQTVVELAPTLRKKIQELLDD